MKTKKRNILICVAISLIAISATATFGQMRVVEKAEYDKYLEASPKTRKQSRIVTSVTTRYKNGKAISIRLQTPESKKSRTLNRMRLQNNKAIEEANTEDTGRP